MRLGVVLLTYNRRAYAHATLRAVLDHIQPGRLELQVHIASDGDTSEYIDSLRHLAGGYASLVAVTRSNSERGGYGKNYNVAMQTVHASCDYVLPLEDDWVLQRDLPVEPLVEQMDVLGVGCCRLGYIGFTQELRASFVTARDHVWLTLDPESPEPHVFAGHPRIETRSWSRKVEPWPEGLEPGATEFAVAHRAAARRGVGWPLWYLDPGGRDAAFVHIGAERSY